MSDLERALKQDLHEAYKAILANDDWIVDQGCGIKSCLHCGNHFHWERDIIEVIDHTADCIVLKAQKALAN